MALSEDEVAKLAEILNTLGAARARLNLKSKGFVDDMISRYDEHGPNIRVTEKQWAWLNNLMEDL